MDWRQSRARKFVRSVVPHLAALAVIAGCIWLTHWQLERADEKRAILDRWHDREPAMLYTLDAPFEVPTPVTTGVGKWRAGRQILVDNQVRNGRHGVHVLTPWRAPDDRLFLVNRGWAEWRSRSAPLPDPGVEGAPAGFRGVLNAGPGVGLRLGRVEIRAEPEWPVLVTYFDAEVLAEVYGDSLQPAVIQLDPDHPAHLTGDEWTVVTFGPERHLGYAMTWGSIAAVVALIWLWLSVRSIKIREESEE